MTSLVLSIGRRQEVFKGIIIIIIIIIMMSLFSEDYILSKIYLSNIWSSIT